MGPPGMPSPGGMFPRTGLGAAAALCGNKSLRKKDQDTLDGGKHLYVLSTDFPPQENRFIPQVENAA